MHQFFDDVLPYHQFSLRVAQSDIPRLDAILASVPDWEVAHLQVRRKVESLACCFTPGAVNFTG